MNVQKIEISVSLYAYQELEPPLQKLVDAAKESSQKAYAPYSKFQVGAAVLLDDGTVVTGNNQENAAYPSGLCAERTAMFSANATHPANAPVALAIAAYTDGDFLEQPISPCGSCRQVLLETEKRYGKNIQILLYGKNGIYSIPSITDLLPLAFDKKSLKK